MMLSRIARQAQQNQGASRTALSSSILNAVVTNGGKQYAAATVVKNATASRLITTTTARSLYNHQILYQKYQPQILPNRIHNKRTCIRTHSSSSGSTKPPPLSSLNPNNQNRTNILQEKAEKAAQIHAELQQLLEKQHARRELEKQTPFFTKFFTFLKKSKSEMINIGAAFCCVLMAYQMVNARKGVRKLRKEIGELVEERDELRGFLKVLVKEDGEFGLSVGKLCAEECQQVFKRGNGENYSNADGAGWWSFGKRKNVNNDDANAVLQENATTTQQLEKTLSFIISQEIQKVIGPDAALTVDERKERRVAELQRMIVDADSNASLAAVQQNSGDESGSKVENNAKTNAATVLGGGDDGGLGGVLAEFQKGGDASNVAENKKEGEEKFVKRRKYAI